MPQWTEIEGTKFAIVYDVHGNYDALTAVLSDIDAHEVEGVVYGGDYALFGHRPHETVEAIRNTGEPAILGNTDEYVVEDSKGDIGHWTREQLTAEDLAWLDNLPFGVWIRPHVDATDVESLALVHATPTDVEGLLILERDPFGDREVTDREEALDLVGGLRANLIVHGHIHYVQSGEVGNQRIESVGSAGFPFDGDQRAAYAIASFEDGQWRLEHRRAEYDWESVARAMEDSDTPLSAGRARRIRQARGLPL
jgi:Icc-related predicted phosphoesterase